MKKIILLLALINLTACASLMESRDDRFKTVDGHVDTPPPVVELDIPPVVEQVPIIAAPEPVEPLQTFTVVATDLPAGELLFALARDARLNLDIDPAIEGNVSINAIDQTLPQILKRISRQIALRYYVDGPNLVIALDRPFMRTYRIDYLNMSRETSATIDVSTTIASTGSDASGGGGGGSNSSASVNSESKHDFWTTLEDNFNQLAAIADVDSSVISNRESGTISVYTTAAAHKDIQVFVDTVLSSARRQVLIEVTVVEVNLNDDFQAGVDWSYLSTGDGWDFTQNLLGGTLSTTPFTSATYTNSNSDRDISGAIKALDTFGDVSVMSSPKIMALNNQTSVLKVVDNIVYFTTEVDDKEGSDNNQASTTFETTIHTVPVGFVMNVTPFITENNEVILSIRPTISRVLRFVTPPTINLPGLVTFEQSEVPEIQVREMESVMRVSSGSTAVLGGLMQDTSSSDDTGLPGLHDAKGFGILFGTKSREYNKTELVIFLRPRVIDNASLNTNLRDFQKFLKPQALSGQ
jgi:general secretion pathway protein D